MLQWVMLIVEPTVFVRLKRIHPSKLLAHMLPFPALKQGDISQDVPRSATSAAGCQQAARPTKMLCSSLAPVLIAIPRWGRI